VKHDKLTWHVFLRSEELLIKFLNLYKTSEAEIANTPQHFFKATRAEDVYDSTLQV
jgi:hypothetical protein